jgi:hypothetical protein
MPLRVAASQADPGEAFAAPADRSSLEELRLLVWRTVDRDTRLKAHGALAALAGTDLTPGQAWMLSAVAANGPRPVTVMAHVSHSTVDAVIRVAGSLRDKGLVDFAPPLVTATESGRRIAQSMLAQEHLILRRLTDAWPGSDLPEVSRLVDDITAQLNSEDVPLARA